MTFVEATSLIESLKPGMRVRVVRHGGTPAVMTVTRGPHRSNGAFGDAYSLAVTLSFGPGRYITDVAVDHLVRRRGRGGRGWIGGGTAMELAE
jgi:hypothetical protein